MIKKKLKSFSGIINTDHEPFAFQINPQITFNLKKQNLINLFKKINIFDVGKNKKYIKNGKPQRLTVVTPNMHHK